MPRLSYLTDRVDIIINSGAILPDGGRGKMMNENTFESIRDELTDKFSRTLTYVSPLATVTNSLEGNKGI